MIRSKVVSWLKMACSIVVSLFIMCSCKYDSRNDILTAPCNTIQVGFRLTVKPIIDNNCIVCHATVDAAGGLNFESYRGVRGPALDGRLLGSIKHLSGFVPMPELAPKLPDCDIMEIEKWVSDGALDN